MTQGGGPAAGYSLGARGALGGGRQPVAEEVVENAFVDLSGEVVELHRGGRLRPVGLRGWQEREGRARQIEVCGGAFGDTQSRDTTRVVSGLRVGEGCAAGPCGEHDIWVLDRLVGGG